MVKVKSAAEALKGTLRPGQVAPKKKTKTPSFYPADDVKYPLKKTITNNKTKLRPSIAPGTVLILLAGHFKGKRVIFLKQLFGPSTCHWAIQGQWCSASSRTPVVRHRHQDDCRRLQGCCPSFRERCHVQEGENC